MRMKTKDKDQGSTNGSRALMGKRGSTSRELCAIHLGSE